MSYHDNILEILRKRGLSSCKEVRAILAEEYDCVRNVRTVLRQLNTLQDKGIVKQVSIGRELVYGLVTPTRTSGVSEFFLNKFWKELFRIRQDLVYHDYPAEAFVKLRSLVRMLPEESKQQIMPKVEKLGSKLGKNRIDYGLDDYGKIRSFSLEVEGLVDEVSSLLHKELKLETE